MFVEFVTMFDEFVVMFVTLVAMFVEFVAMFDEFVVMSVALLAMFDTLVEMADEFVVMFVTLVAMFVEFVVTLVLTLSISLCEAPVMRVFPSTVGNVAKLAPLPDTTKASVPYSPMVTLSKSAVLSTLRIGRPAASFTEKISPVSVLPTENSLPFEPSIVNFSATSSP